MSDGGGDSAGQGAPLQWVQMGLLYSTNIAHTQTGKLIVHVRVYSFAYSALTLPILVYIHNIHVVTAYVQFTLSNNASERGAKVTDAFYCILWNL